MHLVFGRLTVAVMAIGALTVSSLSPARAQPTDAEFFKGKTVHLIVGFSAGGGYDVYARLVAPFIAKALGAGNVIVENQPGAGGLTSINRMIVQPTDGLNIILINGTGAALAQLTDAPGARFDLAELGQLGTVSASPWMWLAHPPHAVKTPADAITMKGRLAWGAGGPMDGLSDGAAFVCEALKLDCRIVLGYPGSNEAALAVVKGEMDMIYVSDTSANNYVKSGQIRPIATISRTKSRFFPEQPTIFEAMQLTPDQEWLFDFRSTLESLGRILAAPPKMPAARLAYMQEAVKRALTDPELIAEGERTQRYIGYLDAAGTQKNVSKIVRDLSTDQKQRVKQIVTKRE